mgnify:CR=1 FL=1
MTKWEAFKKDFKLWLRFMFYLFALLLIITLLPGCVTQIDHKSPPIDFPQLKITIQVVDQVEMRNQCSKYSSAWEWTLACAIWNFDLNTCNIWIIRNEDDSILHHELLHCKGHDHFNDDTLEKAWNLYKEKYKWRPRSPLGMRFNEHTPC